MEKIFYKILLVLFVFLAIADVAAVIGVGTYLYTYGVADTKFLVFFGSFIVINLISTVLIGIDLFKPVEEENEEKIDEIIETEEDYVA